MGKGEQVVLRRTQGCVVHNFVEIQVLESLPVDQGHDWWDVK